MIEDRRLYRVWSTMIQRCTNPNSTNYCYYGAKGIKVCERWRIYANFCADVSPTYRPGLTLDRYPNNNGDYEPDNFRWASPSEQTQNSRGNSKLVTINGITLNHKQWAERTGISYNTLNFRLRTGWSLEDALTRPKGKR